MANEPTTGANPPRKSRVKRYLILAASAVILLLLLYRWLPTSHYEGTIQRVYEKVGEFRVEMVTEDGEVRVFTNSEMRFPYLKFDTADVQANLDRFRREGDFVRVSVWGVRSAMVSAFPNVVDVERLSAGESVREGRTDRVTKAVMAELRARQLVPAGEEEELSEALRTVIHEAQIPGR